MNNKLLLIPTLLMGTVLLNANVTGVVYKDLPLNGSSTNIYGQQDSNEVGIKNITVTAYPDNLTTVTDANGTWSLSTSSPLSRIEFSNIPNYLKTSPIGINNNSLVQFISNGSSSNLALHNPADYTEANPFLTTAHFINGKAALNTAEPTTFKWPYTNSGFVNANQSSLSNTDDMRSVWGLAYNKTKQQLFSATFLRRHVGIKNQDLGAIYLTDTSNNSTSLFTQIPNAGSIGDDLSRDLQESNQPSSDKEAYAKVAKVGLGDIEISDDESTLYTVNLANKTLYALDSSTGDTLKTFDLTSLQSTCSNGELRPFAVTEHKGSLYVGTVCDASSATCTPTQTAGYCAELTAQIQKLPLPLGTGNGSEIFKMRLDYAKGLTHTGSFYSTAHKHNWNPWNDVYGKYTDSNRTSHPTPVLSNIKFDEQENIYLAFVDRTGMQYGFEQKDINGLLTEKIIISGGDILKATLDNNNQYVVANLDLIDDAPALEDKDGTIVHTEGALGAVAHLAGSKEIVFTEYDLLNLHQSNTKGVVIADENNGSKKRAYEVATENLPSYFGKSTSLGDLEFISKPAPTEIGNRIWSDDNGNCIQDANESGIAGINLQLLDSNNTVIANQTTDANGLYLFTNITPNQNYTVRVVDSNQSQLNGKVLTTNCSGVSNRHINSDAQSNNSSADILINASDIPIAGANNHSFDIGFKPKNLIITAPTTYILGDKVWLDSNINGIQESNENGIDGVTATLYNNSNCTGNSIKTTNTSGGGLYQFTNLQAGSYCIQFSNFPTDHNITLANRGSDDSKDSDVSANGQIQSIQLSANDLKEDLGLYHNPNNTIPPVAIGGISNSVWLDNNKNGIRDNADTGINNITVNLYNSSDCTGNIFASTTTNSQGNYQFTNLPKGNYCLAFNGLPKNLTVTTANQGSDESKDSDADSNAQIKNINVDATNLSLGLGLTKNTAVLPATQINDDCNCSDYETSSVPSLHPIALLVLFLLTSLSFKLITKDMEDF